MTSSLLKKIVEETFVDVDETKIYRYCRNAA